MRLSSISLPVLGLAGLVLTGCSTYRPLAYSASAENVLAIKAADAGNVEVSAPAVTGPVTLKKSGEGDESIMCRAAGPVAPPEGQTFESYVHDAMVSELKLAGVYSEAAQKSIKLNIAAMDFGSQLSSGEWNFTVNVTIGSQPSYTVLEDYKFDTGWSADKACQEVAQALGPAVQDMLKKIVTDDKFKSGIAAP